MGRRAKRVGMWACVAAFVVLVGAMAWGVIRPASVGRGGVVVATARGNLEVAWADCSLTRRRIAYNLSYPEGNGSILVGPESGWKPSMARAAIGVSPMILYRLRVVYVPMWPWVVAMALAAAGMWMWAGKFVRPGHCAGCGYDLSGLPAGKCPECGGLAAKLVRWLGERAGRRAIGLRG